MASSMGRMFPLSWVRIGFACALSVVFFAATHTAHATEASADEKAAVEFVTNIASQAFDIHNDKALSDDERFDRYRGIMARGLAIEFIGRFMLGSFYEKASSNQLQEYNSIFPEYITRYYAEQLGNIAKAEMSFERSATNNRGDVIVRTQIKRENGKPIVVDWRVRIFTEDGQKIVDIIVEGASLMFVKRDEFRALINSKGFDALIAELRRQAKMPRETAQKQ